MLSPTVRVLDINPYGWRRLFDTLFPRRYERRLIVVHRRGEILKAFDSGTGSRPDLRSVVVHDAPGLARRLYETEGAQRVFVLERDALDRYFAAIRALYDPGEDGDHYLQRARLLLEADPDLVCYPPLPRGLHLAGVAYETWAAIVAAVPDGQTLVLGIFDEGRMWASLIVRVEGGKITLVTTSDAVMPLEAPTGDWREESRALLAGVAAKIGLPFAGLSCTREAFLDLVAADDKLERLGFLLAEGSVILDPWPCRIPKLSRWRGVLISEHGG